MILEILVQTGIFISFFVASTLATLPDTPVLLHWAEQPECSANPPPHSCAAYLQAGNSVDDLLNNFIIPQSNSDTEPDAARRTPELITSKGYPLETHYSITSDGYILTTYRIPYSLKNSTTPRPAVLIMHGILGASHDFLLNEPSRCLPFILADAGYDVWIGNNRGTSYSQEHVNYTTTPLDQKYWNFSFHEMGTKDLPSIIDMILGINGQPSLYYVGFSQGTLQYLVYLSENPTFYTKIRFAALMGPVAYYSNATNPVLQTLAQAAPLANVLFNSSTGEFGLPLNASMETYFACNANYMSRLACANVLFAVFGFNNCQMNCSRVPLYLSHDPEATSFKDFWHQLQLISSGKFRQFDTRLIGGLEILPPKPKEYNLNNVRSKTALYSGLYDELANYWDVQILEQALRKNNVLVDHKIVDFAHLDFYWGLQVKELVYDDILLKIQQN